MMTANHNYLITSLDLHLVDLEDFKYGGTNITAFRFVDPSQPEVVSVVESWRDGDERFPSKNSKLLKIKVSDSQRDKRTKTGFRQRTASYSKSRRLTLFFLLLLFPSPFLKVVSVLGIGEQVKLIEIRICHDMKNRKNQQ